MTGEKIGIAQKAIAKLLYTLNEEDNVNIITYAGTAETDETEYKFLEPCFKAESVKADTSEEIPSVYIQKGILVPATKGNKNMLIKRLQTIKPEGKSDLEVVKKAINAYTKIYSSSSDIDSNGPKNTIVIITDGFQDVQDQKSQSVDSYDKYSIYTFLVGSQDESASAGAKKVTCDYGGNNFELTSPSNLIRHIISFLESLHYQGLAHDFDPIGGDDSSYWSSNKNGIWTQPYPSRVMGFNLTKNFEQNKRGDTKVYDEWVMTVSHPVESNIATKRNFSHVADKTKLPNNISYDQLLGVAAIELPLKKIYEIIKPYNLGPSGYVIIYKRISGRVIIHPALRNAVMLENAEFINDGIYEIKVSDLEPDLFDINNLSNHVTLKAGKGINAETFTTILDHKVPVDQLGNYYKRTSNVKNVPIKNSPFDIMFVFDVVSQTASNQTC